MALIYCNSVELKNRKNCKPMVSSNKTYTKQSYSQFAAWLCYCYNCKLFFRCERSCARNRGSLRSNWLDYAFEIAVVSVFAIRSTEIAQFIFLTIDFHLLCGFCIIFKMNINSCFTCAVHCCSLVIVYQTLRNEQNQLQSISRFSG